MMSARLESSGAVLLLAVRKSDPRTLWRNPVLLLVFIGAVLTTAVAVADLFAGGAAPSGGTAFPRGFDWALAFWLWATLLTANVAEALAEGRGRSETAALRVRRDGTTAHRVRSYDAVGDPAAIEAWVDEVDAADLRTDDVVVVQAGDIVPTDGEVVWGSASVDESGTTGVSEAAIRSSGGDRSSVTGATKVLSGRIVVRVTARQGATVVDTMLDLAEGAVRQKAPTELALFALLASLSISFVLIALTLNTVASPVAPALSIPVLVTIVVCLIPAEIAALLSVTGIAAMYQLLKRNVLVDSSHALETAGDITTVVLDKTGTITEGNRRATEFVAMATATRTELIRAAVLASRDDPSPEGVSTLALAALHHLDDTEVEGRVPVPFSARARTSGCDLPDGTQIRRGTEHAILDWVAPAHGQVPQSVVDHLHSRTETIARSGGTPLVVAIKPPHGPARLLGVIHLKDVIRSSVRARISRVRALGIRVVMVTGDNPTTAEAIAKEVGVGAYHGDVSATDKLALVKQEQATGHLVAMSGDGNNDVAALAQADIGVAMNTATAAAKSAANMVILDDDPTKILDIIEIGRRQMATRGALVTFNLANDLVRYFTLFPALFVGTFPGLGALNVLRLHTPASAILSTVIFGVVVIGILIPLALAGAPYQTADLSKALRRNLVYYGVGGIAVAAAAIKLIDLLVSLVPGY
jgi:K+-transporting ATPase ATPase B chain